MESNLLVHQREKIVRYYTLLHKSSYNNFCLPPVPWDAIHWKHKIVKPHNPPVDHLNAAESMAKLDRIASDQIDYLVSELHNTSGIDFNNDWKMLTILIGANDLCVCCDGRNASTPADWARRYNYTLSLIKERIPRVFVNIVTLFNISQGMCEKKKKRMSCFFFILQN